MPPQLAMEPGGIPGPAGRLEAIGYDISLLHDEVGQQAGSAYGAAGSPRIAAAGSDFKAAMQAAFRAIGEDTQLLSKNVLNAKVSYQSADAGAATVTALT